MSMVRHFRELRVYRAAFDAAMRIFELSKKWPDEVREEVAEYSVTEGPTPAQTHIPTHREPIQ